MPFTNFNNESGDALARGDNDLQLVPYWSIVLAVAVFIGVQYLFFDVMPHGGGPHGPHHDVLAFRILESFTWGAALASYSLLIGYISRDVKRRNMSARVWMLIVLLGLPGGIGVVVYFLLREPIQVVCPGCHSQIAASHNFCPQCRYQLAPICGQCHRSVRPTDVYCTQCGHDLADDQTPARLRA